MPRKQPNRGFGNKWGFFSGIKDLLSAFPQATTAQKVAIVAMGLAPATFIGMVSIPGIKPPPWALVTMFVVVIFLLFFVVSVLVTVERGMSAPYQCRQVPTYPPDERVRHAIRGALNEIRSDAFDQIAVKSPGLKDAEIRANIFLLAKIQGGKSDGKWKLVIHKDFAINMNLPAERQLQFAIGQGSTGIAYRDGNYMLTRRLRSPKNGDWELKFQMTPELEAQIEPRLKWIVSFPLLRLNTTSEAVGVLNIDGLNDVPDDDVLNKLATSVREKVDDIAKALSLQPSTCVGFDQLGVMENV